jgi:hypothetical protein
MAVDKPTKVEILEATGVIDAASLTRQEVQRLNQLTDAEVESILDLRRKFGEWFHLFCKRHERPF